MTWLVLLFSFLPLGLQAEPKPTIQYRILAGGGDVTLRFSNDFPELDGSHRESMANELRVKTNFTTLKIHQSAIGTDITFYGSQYDPRIKLLVRILEDRLKAKLQLDEPPPGPQYRRRPNTAREDPLSRFHFV